MDIGLLNAMILAIKEGVADKLTKGIFTVYKVGNNLIRIDILIGKENKKDADSTKEDHDD